MGFTATNRIFLGNDEINPNNSFLGNQNVGFNTFTQDTFAYRNDPYSASLQIAMPMSQFSPLGMASWKDNVAANIRGTGTNLSLISSGSEIYPSSSFIASYSTGSWSSEGYTTSGFTGRQSMYGAPTTTNINFGSSDFVIECYVLIPASSIGANFQATIFGQNSGDYLLSDISTQGNSIRFYIGGSGGPVANTWSGDTWYHLAYVRSGNNYYSYVSGTRKGNFTRSGAVPASPDGFWRLLGYYLTDGSSVPVLIQDFRLYIGTDKGYNTATITPPLSIVQKT